MAVELAEDNIGVLELRLFLIRCQWAHSFPFDPTIGITFGGFKLVIRVRKYRFICAGE